MNKLSAKKHTKPEAILSEGMQEASQGMLPINSGPFTAGDLICERKPFVSKGTSPFTSSLKVNVSITLSYISNKINSSTTVYGCTCHKTRIISKH